ncbi:MAG: hypothetical protein O3C34_00245 [Proteobacteria bacterium]|nr:hypothetical protein [Pseudomonadota bacterium]
MSGGAQENAMTEIALAMAMGFFSVMVLTAMSMGVSVPAAKSQPQRPDRAMISAVIADSGPARATGSVDKLTNKDVLVVFDGSRFFGRDLKPFDLATIDDTKRVVLAVTPDLSMAQAIEARRKIAASRLVITTLDGNWRRALQEKKNAL